MVVVVRSRINKRINKRSRVVNLDGGWRGVNGTACSVQQMDGKVGGRVHERANGWEAKQVRCWKHSRAWSILASFLGS